MPNLFGRRDEPAALFATHKKRRGGLLRILLTLAGTPASNKGQEPEVAAYLMGLFILASFKSSA